MLFAGFCPCHLKRWTFSHQKNVVSEISSVPDARKRSAQNSDWIPVELNPKDFIALSGKKGKETAGVTVADKDPRREILESALRKYFGGKISDDILSEYIQRHSDDNAMWHIVKDGSPQTVMLREESLAGL